MATSGVDINAPDAAVLAQRLQRWAQSLEDPRPAFDEINRALTRGEGEIFDSQGSALGQSWPAAADPDRKTDPRLLVMTGALRSSLAGQTGESTRVTTSTELRYGTRVAYAKFHEYGTSRMPARPFFGLTAEMRAQIGSAMERYSTP